MTDTVRIGRAEDGLLHVIAPLLPGGGTPPSVLDPAPGVDVAVLEVAGGHLTWSVLALEAPPVAVLDSVGQAQGWVWAVYGEQTALALAEDATAPAGPGDGSVTNGTVTDGTVTNGTVTEASPALPELVASARRLAYAHWAARWWPASVVDAIPALDVHLLGQEIGTLTEECDLLFGARETADASPTDGPFPSVPPNTLPGADVPLPRATDYALAAGPASAAGAADGLTLARGTGGADWRRCPPGLVDASERAVSWEVVRAAARTTVSISVVAAPGPPHPRRELAPWAAVGGTAAPLDVPLRRVADTWVGDGLLDGIRPDGVRATASPHPDCPAGPEPYALGADGLAVDIHLPGFGTPAGPGEDPAAQRAVRARIRDLARSRLAGAAAGTDPAAWPGAPLLRAEIAAANDDSDF
ncbi:hypothetical protein AB0O64_13115 [Streptomyces sp. NPDC088341]|uniref:hypothetical protein n=1 Tax=Streptomyces sp. NPDC088341 TaxID=3154870 RepID=UPI00344934CE